MFVEHIPKPSSTGIPTGMGVDFLPLSKQDSKEGMMILILLGWLIYFGVKIKPWSKEVAINKRDESG